MVEKIITWSGRHFKITLILSVLLGLVGLTAMMAAQFAWMRFGKGVRSQRRSMVLVGSGDAADRVEQRVAADRGRDLQIVARYGEPWGREDVRPVSELGEYLSENRVDDVWIATELEDRQLLEASLLALKDSVVDVHVVPDLYQYRLLIQQVTEWHGLPVISHTP